MPALLKLADAVHSRGQIALKEVLLGKLATEAATRVEAEPLVVEHEKGFVVAIVNLRQHNGSRDQGTEVVLSGPRSSAHRPVLLVQLLASRALFRRNS